MSTNLFINHETCNSTEFELYTSECGRVCCNLPSGLDKKTVGILLTRAIDRDPQILDYIKSEQNVSFGIVPEPAKKSEADSEFWEKLHQASQSMQSVLEGNLPKHK